MIYTLRFLGIPIFTLESHNTEVVYNNGGQFEIAPEPAYEDDEYYYEDTGFGFTRRLS